MITMYWADKFQNLSKMSLCAILRRTLFFLLLPLVLIRICVAQRQRVDGGSNSYTQYSQNNVPNNYPQYNSVQGQYGQGTGAGYSQQLQPQQYYSYNNNNNNNNGYGGTVGAYQQQQQSPQYGGQGNYYYSNGNYPQTQQYSSSSGSYPQSQQYSSYSSSAQSSPYAYGQQTVVVPSSSQGAGGQYGTPQQQPIPITQNGGQPGLTQLSGNGQQQQQQGATQYGGASHGPTQGQQQQYNGGQGQGHYSSAQRQQQPIPPTGQSQGQRGGQYTTRQQQESYFTTPTPLNLPAHPPTLATLLPSLFPTPPPQPIYDPQAAVSAAQDPYEWSFDFAQGTPVIYCSYGANPIPVYNTPKKKCIPYHPLCGITFTCIFDVDPQTGHVWGQSRETRKKK